MSDKKAVMEALEKLPDNASLDEISTEVSVMSAIQRGRSDIAAGRFQSHQQVISLVDSWETEWNSK
jgi:predicted transcriptional regulator